MRLNSWNVSSTKLLFLLGFFWVSKHSTKTDITAGGWRGWGSPALPEGGRSAGMRGKHIPRAVQETVVLLQPFSSPPPHPEETELGRKIQEGLISWYQWFPFIPSEFFFFFKSPCLKPRESGMCRRYKINIFTLSPQMTWRLLLRNKLLMGKDLLFFHNNQHAGGKSR